LAWWRIEETKLISPDEISYWLLFPGRDTVIECRVGGRDCSSVSSTKFADGSALYMVLCIWVVAATVAYGVISAWASYAALVTACRLGGAQPIAPDAAQRAAHRLFVFSVVHTCLALAAAAMWAYGISAIFQGVHQAQAGWVLCLCSAAAGALAVALLLAAGRKLRAASADQHQQQLGGGLAIMSERTPLVGASGGGGGWWGAPSSTLSSTLAAVTPLGQYAVPSVTICHLEQEIDDPSICGARLPPSAPPAATLGSSFSRSATVAQRGTREAPSARRALAHYQPQTMYTYAVRQPSHLGALLPSRPAGHRVAEVVSQPLAPALAVDAEDVDDPAPLHLGERR